MHRPTPIALAMVLSLLAGCAGTPAAPTADESQAPASVPFNVVGRHDAPGGDQRRELLAHEVAQVAPLVKIECQSGNAGRRSVHEGFSCGWKSESPGVLRAGAFRGVPDDDLLSREKDRTIIGAGAFHGPVRDGKVWFHSAMVVRRRGLGGSARWR